MHPRLGLLPDRHDDRDWRFSRVANNLGLHELPLLMDLRPLCSPVRDQEQLGKCSGEALGPGGREFLLNRAGAPATALSSLWLYQQELIREHAFGKDAGARLRDGLRTLLNQGCATAAAWPDENARFADRPDAASVFAAHPFKIAAFHRINNLIEVKQALAIKWAVVAGIAVFDSLMSEDVARTGTVPLPNVEIEQCEGGHAIMLVGYDDARREILWRNSWGSPWAREGYAVLSYEYFNPMRNLVFDIWSFTA